jgi:hypothetical protein
VNQHVFIGKDSQSQTHDNAADGQEDEWPNAGTYAHKLKVSLRMLIDYEAS